MFMKVQYCESWKLLDGARNYLFIYFMVYSAVLDWCVHLCSATVSQLCHELLNVQMIM